MTTFIPASPIGYNVDSAGNFIDWVLPSGKPTNAMTLNPVTQSPSALGVAVSGGSAAPYLGQVATRCVVPLNALGSGSAVWGSGVSMHWARDKIVNPTVVWPMYSVAGTNVETLTAGGTVKCSIATTLGTRLAQNVEGSVSFINGYAVCTFPGTTIPKGSQFWLYHLVQNANGIVFSGAINQPGYDVTEGWTFGTGAVTDYTVAGTPPQSFLLTQGYRPILILGQTTLPSVVITGTSRAAGLYDWVSDASADLGYARLIGQLYGYTSLALGSSTLAAFNSATRTLRNQIFQGTIAGIATGVPYHSHYWGYDLVNDLNAGGDSAASAVARVVTQAAAFPALKFIAVTNSPNPSSSDLFITLANQTPLVKLSTANQLIRLGLAGVSRVADVSDFVDPYRSNKWPVDRNPGDASIASASFTGVIAGNTLTVSALTGTILEGVTIQGAGVNVGAQVQPYGTAGTTGTGGTGTYNLSVNQTVASEAMTTGSLMTWDGLHEDNAQLCLIRDRGQTWLSQLAR